MGHYRSEMGYEDADRKAAERREAERLGLIIYIKKDIRKRGLETVLADIILDPSGYKRIAT